MVVMARLGQVPGRQNFMDVHLRPVVLVCVCQKVSSRMRR